MKKTGEKAVRAIRTLELRRERIPSSPLIRAIEEETGQPLREEIRHYLDGEPVHCGDVLELYRDGTWVCGRYEWSGHWDESATFDMRGKIVSLSACSLLRWPRANLQR